MKKRITDKEACAASEILRMLRRKEVSVEEARKILKYAKELLKQQIQEKKF